MSDITLRGTKGSPLTNQEVDDNFDNLNTEKLQSGDTAASLTISSADINGGTIDGTVIGATTTAAGSFTTVTASGEITANGGIALGDNDKATFGAGDDLQIFHDGSNSFVQDAGTGDLILRGSTGIKLQSGSGALEYLSTNSTNGSVELKLSGVTKLATTSSGIDVTGTATMDSLVVDGASTGRVTLGTFTNTTNAGGTEAALELRNQATGNADVSLVASRLGANFGSDFYIETSDGVDGTNHKRLNIAENGDISFYEDTGTSPKFVWSSADEKLTLSGTGGLTVSNVDGSIVKLESTSNGLGAGAVIGDLQFYGNDASVPGAGIKASITATTVAALGDDSQLMFSTSDGTTNNVNRMLIANNGDLSLYENTGSTPKFFWDASAESLMLNASTRIGTEILTVNGTVTTGGGTASAPALAFRADSNTGMFRPASQALGFSANGTERLRVSATGIDVTGQVKATSDFIAADLNGIARGYLFGTSGGLFARFNSGSNFQVQESGSTKLTVNSTGIDVTGTATMDGLTVGGSGVQVNLLSTNASENYLYMKNTEGSAYIGQDAGALQFWSGGNTGGVGAEVALKIDGNNNISFYEDTGTTPKFFWDASAESLGIGTASPSASYSIDAAKGIRSSAAIPNFTLVETDASNQTWQINSTDAKLSFRDLSRAADRIVVDTVGRVGIGVSSPSTLMEIASTSPVLRITNTTDAAWSAGQDIGRLSFYSTDASAVGPHETAFILNESDLGGAQLSGALSFGTAAYNAAATERLRITSDGLVGINTSSPAASLDIRSPNTAVQSRGNLYVTTTSTAAVNEGAQISLGGTYTGTSETFFGAIAARKENATIGDFNAYLQLSVRSTGNLSEKARITSDGNLLVGKTASDLGATAGIELNGQYDVGYFTRSAEKALVVNRLSTDGSIADFRKDGATVGSIGTGNSGNLYIGSGDAGINFNKDINCIYPINSGTGGSSDGLLDLGLPVYRFKDLYLSGAVNAGADASINGLTVGLGGGSVSTNTAVGLSALQSNTTGSSNTANGVNALRFNTSGSYNTAYGLNALFSNTTGSYNTASGRSTLFSNTTGSSNTASGTNALSLNTTGSNNSASGFDALRSNTTGLNNTASGYAALLSNTTASSNTASGVNALRSNIDGSNNTASGADALYSNTSGSNNTANGRDALRSNTTGSDNTASGVGALYFNTTGAGNSASGRNALYSNTTGITNTASGAYALRSNTTGSSNTASGYGALFSSTTGSSNTAAGYQALYNSTAANTTATGFQALYSNTTGIANTANGYLTLFSNTTGSQNSAFGREALYSNTTGANNVANGFQALYSNTTGGNNIATGYQALYSNTTGLNNSATSYRALYSNTTGNNNVANGYEALRSNTTGSSNSASGANALLSNTSGSSNTASGVNALRSNTTASNNTAVGYQAGYSNTTATGRTTLGAYSGYLSTAGGYSTFVGYAAGYNSTGSGNTFIGTSANGAGAGEIVTTGSKNTILGGYNGNQGGLDIRTANNHIVLSDGDGNPRVIVDASGNALFNCTTSDPVTGNVTGSALLQYGGASMSRNNTPALDLNRMTSDGEILRLRKDGTSVGSIGNNTDFFVASTDGTGLRFSSTQVLPCSESGATQNGSRDLGSSAGRFKDLYLGGGVYLGGTGAANKLDDYEEGTWTPTVTGSTTAGSYSNVATTGNYTKVGNLVTVNMVFYGVNGTGAGDLLIGGLPFSLLSTANAVGVIQANNGLVYPTGTNEAIFYLLSNATYGEVRCNKADGSSYAKMQYPNQPGYIRLNITYMTS